MNQVIDLAKTKLFCLTCKLLLAILITLLTACDSHDPRAGQVQDGGPGGQFAGGND